MFLVHVLDLLVTVKKGDFQEYVDTLRYMLCDLGVTIGSVGKGYNGEFFSAFTGSLINIDTIITKIKRFISYAIQRTVC